MFCFFNKTKNVSFSKKMFWRLFWPALIAATSEMAIQLSDEIIVGSLVNENALIAIAITSPIHLVTIFIAGSIIVGTAFCYSRDIGEMDKKHANEVFSQCLILIVIIGIVLFVFGTLLKDYYLNFFGVSNAVRVEIEAYWTYFKYDFILAPLLYFTESMVYADGDNSLCQIAATTLIITRVLFPIALGYKYGIYGVGLGGAVSVLLVIIIYCCHFFKKTNNFSFTWFLSFKEIKEVIKLSLIDSVSMLCLALVNLILNKFVINVYSERYIPIVVIVMAICQFTEAFDSIGKAMGLMGEIYMGENNYEAERDLYIYSFKVSIAIAIIYIIMIVVLAPTILNIYGISSEMMEIGKKSVYIIMFIAPFISLSYIMTSQYVVIRKIGLAIFGTVITVIAFPIFFALICGYLFSFMAMWMGYVFGAGLSVLVLYLFERKYANNNQILKEVQGDSVILNKSFIVNRESINEVQNTIKEFLIGYNIPKSESNKLDLLVEEYILNVLEHNNKTIISECSIIYTKEMISVYFRDTGTIIDWSDPGISISGLSTYVFASLVSNYRNSNYLISSGYNRIVFHFSK